MRFGVNEEVPMLFIVDKRRRLRVIIRGVANLAFVDPEVVMEEHADVALRVAQVFHTDATEKDILVACNRIAADDSNSECRVFESHIGDQRFMKIVEVTRPVVPKNPGERTFDPNSKPKRKSFRVVLLPDVRKINIPNLVFIVEVD